MHYNTLWAYIAHYNALRTHLQCIICCYGTLSISMIIQHYRHIITHYKYVCNVLYMNALSKELPFFLTSWTVCPDVTGPDVSNPPVMCSCLCVCQHSFMWHTKQSKQWTANSHWRALQVFLSRLRQAFWEFARMTPWSEVTEAWRAVCECGLHTKCRMHSEAECLCSARCDSEGNL